MPLWRIFSAPTTFTQAQREGLADSITALYGKVGLPDFYVVVLFVDVDAEHTFVGGKMRSNFVRIVAEQIARQMPAPDTDEALARRKGLMDRFNAALKPWILDRPELDWEIHVAETPRDLWRIQGLDPPPPHSEGELLWKKIGKPVLLNNVPN